ncbi:BolA/IbaG family iron-sulfur metabolism protein [Buchnera aphidicola (Chaitoregma tattakana)]|uniref:BolA/IbaG family iron-sulfur metabolism protein n=1 Tax=Buchnera aphidicola TaxID=9 RepID=UPI0031B85C50
MIEKKIKNILKKKINLYNINVKKTDNNFEIVVVSDIFLNKTELQKQQIVYSNIQKLIFKKKIHAVTIYAYSIKEWKKKSLKQKTQKNK